ncbi:MAG: hypothetical protein EOM23_06920 [Candidatus Moranbacteria bacterium]|nr:hypothetical protein [Candidatus Moranbacteria bacterium]
MKQLNREEVPCVQIEGLTENEIKALRLADNKIAELGEWDMGLAVEELKELSPELFDLTGFDKDSLLGVDDFSEDFSLKDGDKEPFQQMTFTLADEQAEQIKSAIADIKQSEEYKYAETMGNENSNGNALYLIVIQWVEQRK